MLKCRWCLYAGDKYFYRLMEKMRGKFYAGKVEEKTFKDIWFQVKQLENMVIIDHSEYIKKVQNKTLDPERASHKNEHLDAKNRLTIDN